MMRAGTAMSSRTYTLEAALDVFPWTHCLSNSFYIPHSELTPRRLHSMRASVSISRSLFAAASSSSPSYTRSHA